MREEYFLKLLAAYVVTWFEHSCNHQLLWTTPGWLNGNGSGFLDGFVSLVANLFNFNSTRLDAAEVHCIVGPSMGFVEPSMKSLENISMTSQLLPIEVGHPLVVDFMVISVEKSAR